MRTLLVGLTPSESEALHRGLARSGRDGELVAADSIAHAVDVLRLHEVNCVVLGAGGLGDAGWDGAAAELRRLAPYAALVALGPPALAATFDDAVGPDELAPDLVARVVRSAHAVARAHDRLARWALHDPLTDVLNRRGLERALARETSRRDRGLGPLSALLVDCDDFKRVNDRVGLAAGDDVLRRIAGAIRDAVRTGDTVARIGGDEFAVLLPNTRTWEAVEVAERIRERVRTTVLADGVAQTVSIGVRRMDGGCSSIGELLGATEEGVKASKALGKDSVRVVQPGGASAVPVVGAARRAEVSLPPGTRLLRFRASTATDLATGLPAFAIVEPDLSPDKALLVAAQRAAHTGWDLTWLKAALEAAEGTSLPLQVRVYPATLLEVPPALVLGALPDGLDPRRVTLAVDEQFLSVDPTALASRLAPYTDRGFGLCVDTADLGRSCYETTILLRPSRIVLEPELATGIAANRAGRVALKRFVAACGSLGVDVVGAGVTLDADRDALREVGVRYVAGGAEGLPR